jgi:hypothetical protein
MNRVLYLLFLIFELFAGPAKALNAAGAGETAFFYQAYRVEFDYISAGNRRIAPGCSGGQSPCGYTKFVEYISSVDAQTQNAANPRIKEILDQAETTDLIETSRKLREANFVADYNQAALLPTAKGGPSITESMRTITNILQNIKKGQFQERFQKMTEALNLVAEVRRADNMKYFIPNLEKELGLEVEKKPETTKDGLQYIDYDIQETAKKNQGVADLAEKYTAAANKLRTTNNKKEFGKKFVIHQNIIRQAQNSADILRKMC